MGYQFKIEDCDVENSRSLERFRARRSEWLDWLDDDEHHPIIHTIGEMVWRDVSFRVIAGAGQIDEGGPLANPLLIELLVGG